MISKEILSAVLGKDVKYIHDTSFVNELVYSLQNYGEMVHINIYELAHMVKEWADTKGYYIVQDTRGFTKVARFGTESRKFWEDEEYTPERTFDCGEWILKEISK